MSDSLLPLSESLPMQLLRAREVIMRRLKTHCTAHDLTEQQWRVIRVLAEARSTDMHRLAEGACIHAPSLSRIVPKLEARELIRRTPGVVDHRQVFIELSEAGRALFEAIGDFVAWLTERCHEGLPSSFLMRRGRRWGVQVQASGSERRRRCPPRSCGAGRCVTAGCRRSPS